MRAHSDSRKKRGAPAPDSFAAMGSTMRVTTM